MLAEMTSMDELLDEMSDYAAPFKGQWTIRFLHESGSKWIVRSGLQKCIRRGDWERAKMCAEFLHALDEAYCWRSMGTIGIEDIGPGVCDQISYALVMANCRKPHHKIDSQSLLLRVVHDMCMLQGKTRAFCEASVAFEFDEPVWSDNAKKLTETLLHELLHGSFQEKFVASSVLRGWAPKYAKIKRPKDWDDIGALMKQYRALLPFNRARCAMLTMEYPLDLMYFGVGSTLLQMQTPEFTEGQEIVDEKPSWPEATLLLGLPSPVFDMHVSQGKVALKAFHTSMCNSKIREAMAIPPEKSVNALGAVIFVEEGALLDNRLMGGGWSVLRKQHDDHFIELGGVALEQQPALRAVVRAQIPRLNQKRKWVLTAR